MLSMIYARTCYSHGMLLPLSENMEFLEKLVAGESSNWELSSLSGDVSSVVDALS